MGLFGHSSNVTAQKWANQGNLDLAKKQNEYDVAMFNATNAWNLEQWNRENEYNSPASQMQRYIEAGINPLWAMSDANAGQAQQLTSADPPRAHEVTLQPEWDPYETQRLANIVTASRDVVNAGLGFSRLGVEAYDADTRRAAQLSQEHLNLATAGQKRAATTAQEVETKWNLATFDTRAEAEQQKLVNMKHQMNLMDKQSDSYIALKENYEASTALAREKYNRIAEDYKLAWQRIAIDRYNAESNRIGANASASQAASAAEQVSINRNMARATVDKWNNDQLLDFLKSFGQNISHKNDAFTKAGLKGGVGSIGGSFEAGYSGQDATSQRLPASIEMMEAAGLRAIQWAADEPDNPQAVEAAKLASRNLDTYESTVFNPVGLPLDRPHPSQWSDSSVLNPPDPLGSFGSRSSWQ